jgi:D-beta-D-heptose 7-phosphate kinase/D-beta-D-heptose 1-phosphate adenosyltransferase
VGNDAEGARLVGELREAGIGTGAVLADTGRCTTRKLRVVTTRNQQVARIDYECDTPAQGALESELAKKITESAAHADVILVSDYQKGGSRASRRRPRCRQARRGIPSLPRSRSLTRLLRGRVAHHAEPPRGRSNADADHTADEARTRRSGLARAQCEWCSSPRRACGMCSDSREFDLPAEAREVSDVTGAGDTVIAAMALGLAARARSATPRSWRIARRGLRLPGSGRWLFPYDEPLGASGVAAGGQFSTSNARLIHVNALPVSPR